MKMFSSSSSLGLCELRHASVTLCKNISGSGSGGVCRCLVDKEWAALGLALSPLGISPLFPYALARALDTHARTHARTQSEITLAETWICRAVSVGADRHLRNSFEARLPSWRPWAAFSSAAVRTAPPRSPCTSGSRRAAFRRGGLCPGLARRGGRRRSSGRRRCILWWT